MDKLEQVIKGLECCSQGLNCAEKCPYDDDNDDCNECTSALTKDALELLKDQKWYSIDEKLPDEYATYFVYTEKGEILRVEFRPDKDYEDDPYYQWGYVEPDAPEGWISFYELHDDDDCSDNILYWRKFPKPPKDGDQE